MSVPFQLQKGSSTESGSRGFQQTPKSFHTKYTVTPKPFCVTHQNNGGDSKGDLRRKSGRGKEKGGGRMKEAECKQDRDIKPPLVLPDRC